MSGLHLFEFSCEVSCFHLVERGACRRGGEGDFLSITSRMYELCRNLDGGEPHKSEMLERVGNAERFDDWGLWVDLSLWVCVGVAFV